jgi:hypothetical protein
MTSEVVKVIDRKQLNELLHERRVQQIYTNLRAVPRVLVASAAALAAGLYATQSDAATPQEISKALKPDPRHSTIVDNGGDFAEKFFLKHDLQGGEPPFIGSVTIATAGNAGANIRLEPNTSAGIILVAENGNQFNVLEVSNDGQWYKIQLADGQQGWVFAELVNFSAQAVAAPEPGTDSGTLEPQGGGRTLEAPIIPGPDGIPTPSFLTPGAVIGPMATFGYPAIQNVMQMHPDWFQPSASTPEFERTGFDQSMTIEGVLRGCAVIDTMTDSNGRVLSPYDQMFCVVEVQSNNPNGIGSFFLILRSNIADGQMGGNVGVVRNGDTIILNDAEAARDMYTQAPAMTRVRLEFRPSAFGGNDVYGELSEAIMTASIENLRIAIQTGTPIAPLNVMEIIQDLAQRRNVPVSDLENYAGSAVSGVPVPFRTSLVLS